MDSPPLTPLGAFRQAVYRCFTRAEDALFETVDALLTEDRARTFVELSEAPAFHRRWPSLSAALSDGQIDRAARRRRFVQYLPRSVPGERLVLGLDTSPIHRPEAPTLADRTWVYCPNLPAGTAPARPGWQFSTVVALPDPPSSWTYLLDNQRVSSTETATTVGARQLAALVPLLPARPLLIGDGHYGTAAWVQATAGLHLKPCREVALTVLRIVRGGAAGTARDPHESWFWWVGGPLPPLAALPGLYARRFGIEHGDRFDKQALLWEAPRLRTPEQFQRWTDLVAITHNQLVLARSWAEITVRPWDAATRAVTPAQVRRAMRRILPQVDTPARPPRPRGKSPGRAKRPRMPPAPRYAVIRTGARRVKRRAGTSPAE